MSDILLDTPAAIEARRARIGAPHMGDLPAYAASLRDRFGEVPDADPDDGGVGARLLLLLETPGPRIGRTGIVSADNRSGTGANLRRFFAEAGIARRERVIWNAVPWVVHGGDRNRALRPAELRDGLALLPGFLPLLPQLRVAVLAGRPAAGAAPIIARERPGIAVLHMPHPSPTYVCTSPEIPRRIRAALAEAANLLGGPAAY